jgi:type II restriction/modification system DNA methylase subunit YeeA
MLIIGPVVVEPLEREWAETRAQIEALLEREASASSASAATKAHNEAQWLYSDFIDRIARFRVLDPACGSGNFLYLALLSLKDLEHRVNLEAEALGFQRRFPEVGPHAVLGIEINPYAAELARVSVWIGEIQWMLGNGFAVSKRPILKPLDTIECRDALLTAEDREAPWPAADAIIGNPPFLGGKLLRSVLGDESIDLLLRIYEGRVPAEADLVCYWFKKAWQRLRAGKAAAVGLVATNSIRGGASRRVIDPIAAEGLIFEAWDDEPWVDLTAITAGLCGRATSGGQTSWTVVAFRLQTHP